MTNLEEHILSWQSPSTYQQTPFQQHNWNTALKEQPRLSLTHRNPAWCNADNSCFYNSYPVIFGHSSASCSLYLAAQITLGDAVSLTEPERKAEDSLKLLVSSFLNCSKFTSLTLGMMRTKLAMIKCLESEISGLSGMEVELKTYFLFSKYFFLLKVQSY